MKVGYVVSALGRGGAELQLLQLAAGMVDRGHAVSVIAYAGPGVLDDVFLRAGIEVVSPPPSTRLQKIVAVRSWLAHVRPDVVHAIQRRASSLALMARWPARRPAVIATDYSSATYGPRTAALRASLAAFAWADRVVTEVNVNRESIERLAPWLRGKTLVVRNGLDVDRFAPDTSRRPARDAAFVFCAVGTLSAVKNPLRVVAAADLLRARGRTGFKIDWYGRDSLDAWTDVGPEARAQVASRDLGDHVVFHGDTVQIEGAYRRSDALLHASVHEGFPNAVAEGMACGLPLVVSRVSDLPLVVAEARNGFVFDETDPNSIATAMERMMDVPVTERAAMGTRSRALTLRWFRVGRFLDEFEELYRAESAGGH